MEFADGYEGVTHAGVALVAADTGRFLLAQRAFDDSDAPDVAETLEFPGGSLEDGEDAQAGAFREFHEETGMALDGSEVVNGWRQEHYQGFVVVTEAEFDLDDSFDPEEVQALGWFTVSDAESMIAEGTLRPELHNFDWSLVDVSGNKEDSVEETEIEEPEFDVSAFVGQPIPVHGVIAPEGTESGDSRGFAEGSMTTRPLRIPLRFQKSDVGGHNGAITVGSVDRVMRKDGLIHWEGLLMPTAEAGELLELIEFFGNRYGVSVDGDQGALDEALSQERGGTWFKQVRAAGLTAVAIPAFEEAYISAGPHPEMPAEMDDSVMTAGACPPALLAFKRGKGWATHPKETNRLHNYWTKKGEPGYAKIGWGTPGDFRRARALIGEKIAKNSPEKMRYLNQIIAEWHHDALGYWPGELDKPGNKTSAQAKAEREAKLAAESVEDIEMDAEGSGWEAVLVSSATATRVAAPAEYFSRHPETGATVVEDPDENGFRRTHGYAAEWGVCHIGFSGECVEVPADPTGGEYADFHLGRTRVSGGESDYINTGLITYKTEHRDAKTILTQTAEQAHYDNIAHAWAAVRIGEDERGVWFSGVVLPRVDDEDLTLIEAAGQVSGEWKYGALRGLQSVNIPGFPVLRSSAVQNDEGEVIALVASGTGSRCAPTPEERIAAIRQVEVEARFQKLRDEFQKEN